MIITFLFSGLFHEYQFLLSFDKYSLGSISVFFGMHAIIGALPATRLERARTRAVVASECERVVAADGRRRPALH